MNAPLITRLAARNRHQPPTVDRRRRRQARATWQRPDVLAAIVAGAIPGAICREELGLAVTSRSGAFPLATFIINVSGSFVIGVLLTLILERWRPSEYVRPFAATGFLGAYTTWSTFMVDTVKLLEDGHAAIALLYVSASLIAGLLAVYAGAVLVRKRPLAWWHREREADR